MNYKKINTNHRANKINNYLISNEHILTMGNTDTSLLYIEDGKNYKGIVEMLVYQSKDKKFNINQIGNQFLEYIFFNDENLSNVNTYYYENKYIAKMDELNIVVYSKEELFKSMINCTVECIKQINENLYAESKIDEEHYNFIKNNIVKYDYNDLESISSFHDRLNENRYILSNLLEKNIKIQDNPNKKIISVRPLLMTPNQLTQYCKDNNKNKDLFDDWTYNKKYIRDYKYDCIFDKKTLKYVSNRVLLHEKLNSE